MTVTIPAKTADLPRRDLDAPRGRLRPSWIGAAVLIVVCLTMPLWTSAYWLQTFTSTAIYAVVALSVSLLLGRVGLISLCQFALLAVGTWTALRLGYASDVPFVLVLLGAGVVTGVIGVVVGLPALRLSGLYLALITLMAAAGVTVALAATQFPNGGKGFLGFSATTGGTASLQRPSFAESDSSYFVLVVVVTVLLFGLVVAHLRAKPGRAWAAIRQSESTAVAAGINIVLYKLWAFALAAFIAGVAGGMLAASGGGITTYQFPTENNILLLAAVLMGGAYSVGGAVVAAVFVKVVPALLQTWSISSDVLMIAFGIGVLQTMLSSPRGVAGQLEHDLGRLLTRLRGRKS